MLYSSITPYNYAAGALVPPRARMPPHAFFAALEDEELFSADGRMAVVGLTVQACD